MHSVIETTDNQFHQYWNKLVASDPLQNPLYAPLPAPSPTPAGGFESSAQRYRNHSFMVVREEEPVFGCSVTSNTDANGLRRLGFYGREASTLVNRNQMAKPGNNFEPEAIELLMQHFLQLMQDISPDVLEYFDPVSCGLMSPLTQILLEKGALPQIHKSQIIRLALSERALLSGMDEQFAAQIQWGAEQLVTDIMTGERARAADEDLFALCKAYSPTADCGEEFFQTCASMIAERRGFIVRSALETADKALFVHNKHTCHLVIADAPGQSDSLPVLQTMLWEGIRYSKQLQCAFFDLGGKIIQADQLDLKKFGGDARTRIRVSYSQ